MYLYGTNAASGFNRDTFWAYDVYVFDVDDTLLYTFRNGFLKINAAAAICGLPKLSFARYKEDYGVFSFSECLQRWFPAADTEQVKQCYASMWKRVAYQPVCDFSALQQILHQKRKRVALLTNGTRDEKLYRKLEICRVDLDHLEGLWCAEDIPERKPSPLAIAPIQERFPGKHLLCIGDADSDRQMAYSAGAGFLQVCSGKERPLPGVSHIPSLAVLLAELGR